MGARASFSAPVTAEEFAVLMGEALAASEPAHSNLRSFAIAFSGGPDSLALLFLAARWAKTAKKKILALTVDHGLRPESAREAKQAADLAARLGVAHEILKWKGDKPGSDLQAAARAARYDLLFAACRKHEIDALIVAHHLEDQAETFLLRLSRGSGVDGLAAMPKSRLQNDVLLLRPLLGLPKERLAATLSAATLSAATVSKGGLSAIQDPSNENTRFERVKTRKLMVVLETLGLDARRLANTASHMARARAALEAETARLLSTALLMPQGYLTMEAKLLREAEEEIALRALAEIFRWIGGSTYAPRFEALSDVHAALHEAGPVRGRTLNGCKLSVDAKGRLLAMREAAAALKLSPVKARKGAVVWDGRFRLLLVKAPRTRKGLEWRALGGEGLASLKEAGLSVPAGPKAMLPTLPGLWEGSRLLASPHAGSLVAGVETGVEIIPSALFDAAVGVSP